VSLGCNNVLPHPLDYSSISPICSLPSPSPKYSIDTPIENLLIFDSNVDLGHVDNMFSMIGGSLDNYVPLGHFSGYDPFIDPYCACLEDLPKKVMWTTFFNPSYDLSMVFAKVMRMLILFGVTFVIASYLLFSELWSQEFDKLLHTLTVSDFMSRVLKM